MATLREYFDTGFPHYLSSHTTLVLTDLVGGQIDVVSRLHYDFDANVFFVSYFIPDVDYPLGVVKGLLQNLNATLKQSKEVLVDIGLPGEKKISSADLYFSGRVFFYSLRSINQDEFTAMEKEVRPNGIFIHYRGPEMAAERSKVEKPLAFISHDSRDKDNFARPIAEGLQKVMCPVWYDEYSLKVGDNLRESIEKGIMECKKCVLILSPHFLSNAGWTKTEFNSVFTKELIEEKDVILPVWCGIDKKSLYEFSPSLVNKVGIKFDLGIDKVVLELYKAVTYVER